MGKYQNIIYLPFCTSNQCRGQVINFGTKMPYYFSYTLYYSMTFENLHKEGKENAVKDVDNTVISVC